MADLAPPRNSDIRIGDEIWFTSRVSVLRSYRHLLWSETRPEHAEQLRREIAATLAYFSPSERAMAERTVYEAESRQVVRWGEEFRRCQTAWQADPMDYAKQRAMNGAERNLDQAIVWQAKALECFTAAERALVEEGRRLSAPETKQKAPNEFPRGRRLLAEMEA